MSRHVVYLRGRGEERADLVRALEQRGYQVVFLRWFEELLKHITKTLPQAVVIDASATDADVSERIIELSDAKDLQSIPIIFIGKNAEERCASIAPLYQRFLPVDFPFRLAELFSQLGGGAKAAEEVEEEVPPAELPSQPVVKIHKRTHVDPAKLEKTYGGRVVAAANDLSAFDDELILPTHPKENELRRALNAITAKNEWAGIHARRCAFSSSAIANSLGVGEKRDSVIRLASLFLNWSMVGAEQRLTFDLLQSHQLRQNKIMGDAFRRSADLVQETLDDSEAVELIEAVADLISGHSPSGSSEKVNDAECVLISELVDRACFKSGTWQVSAVPRTLRGLRSMELIKNQEVLGGMAQMLGEAVFTQPSGRFTTPMLPTQERLARQRQLAEAQQYAEEHFRPKDSRKVKLFELRPGMRLAEPIVTLDGLVVCTANTLLDFDIILRILGLTASRPMEDSVRILK